MSIQLMSDVWKLDLSLTEQAVLLVLADHAHDDGTKSFPGVDLIAWKTGCTRRTVQRTLRKLEEMSLVIPVKYSDGGRGRATEYRVNPRAGRKKPPLIKGDTVSPFVDDLKGDSDALKGDSDALKGGPSDAPTINNHQEPPGGKQEPPLRAAHRDESVVDFQRERRERRGERKGEKRQPIQAAPDPIAGDLAEPVREPKPERERPRPLADKWSRWSNKPVEDWNAVDLVGYFRNQLLEYYEMPDLANNVNLEAMAGFMRRWINDSGYSAEVIRNGIDKFVLERPVDNHPAWKVFVSNGARLLSEGRRITREQRRQLELDPENLEAGAEGKFLEAIRSQQERRERRRAERAREQ